jgi:hypothetical protein
MTHPHDHAGHDHSHDQDDDHDMLHECIEACLECHAACTLTVQHCLATGGAHAEVNLVGVLLDCAEICQTSANFLLRGSPYHVVTCSACADLCRACEEGCRTIPGDEQLQQCAEVCAACAEHCEAMARMGDEDEEEEEEEEDEAR